MLVSTLRGDVGPNIYAFLTFREFCRLKQTNHGGWWKSVEDYILFSMDSARREGLTFTRLHMLHSLVHGGARAENRRYRWQLASRGRGLWMCPSRNGKVLRVFYACGVVATVNSNRDAVINSTKCYSEIVHVAHAYGQIVVSTATTIFIHYHGIGYRGNERDDDFDDSALVVARDVVDTRHCTVISKDVIACTSKLNGTTTLYARNNHGWSRAVPGHQITPVIFLANAFSLAPTWSCEIPGGCLIASAPCSRPTVYQLTVTASYKSTWAPVLELNGRIEEMLPIASLGAAIVVSRCEHPCSMEGHIIYANARVLSFRIPVTFTPIGTWRVFVGPVSKSMLHLKCKCTHAIQHHPTVYPAAYFCIDVVTGVVEKVAKPIRDVYAIYCSEHMLVSVGSIGRLERHW